MFQDKENQAKVNIMIKKLTAAVLSIAVCGALLTGCGGNDDASDESAATTPTTSSQTTTEPTTTEPTTTESKPDDNIGSDIESGIDEGADRIESGAEDAVDGARNVVDDILGR